MSKYIFFTGGVVSGLGKGIVAASLGRLLKARGYSVSLLKLDPYFNMDSSYISPYQHGEIFVTGDGTETDLVVGHYERILGDGMSLKNAVTSGQIYSAVMKKERAGEYQGETVQIIPHITDEIKSRIYALEDEKTDIIITEIGGTVGDIECTPFLEAIRQVQADKGRRNVAYIHMTLLPYIESSGEQKTKPTQRSIKELQDVGIQPDAIICRSDYPIGESSKQRISLFCNVSANCIIESLNGEEIYNIPLKLEEQGLAGVVLKRFGLNDKVPDLKVWKQFVVKATESKNMPDKIKIGIVGKYTEKHDAYESISESLFFSALEAGKSIKIEWIASDDLTQDNAAQYLKGLQGIVIPAGFGERGFEGKTAACEYARNNNLPAIAIGMGAQAAVCGFLKAMTGKEAESEEFGASRDTAAVRSIYEGAKAFKCGTFKEILTGTDTKLFKAYGKKEIEERHRHKYEINPLYRAELEKHGMIISAVSAEGNIPEAFELKNHKFFIGVIFRPEFLSKPDKPHPLFNAFIKACSV